MLVNAAADEELPVGQRRTGCATYRRPRSEARRPVVPASAPAAAFAAWASARCGAAAAPTSKDQRNEREASHVRVSRYRMKNWPDGWFEP